MISRRSFWLLLEFADSGTVVAGCGPKKAETVPHKTASPVPTISVSGGDIAATINGSVVTMSRFRDFLRSSKLQDLASHRTSKTPLSPNTVIAREVLTSLVEDELVLQYARTHHLKASPGKIAKLVDTASGKLPRADVTWAAKVNLLGVKVRNMVEPQRSREPVATARDILIGLTPNACSKSKSALTATGARAIAYSLARRLHQGAMFSALAGRCSIERYHLHGDLVSNPANPRSDVLHPGSFEAPLDEAVFHGPVRKFQVVSSQYGYYVLQVLTRHMAKYPAKSRGALQLILFQDWLHVNLRIPGATFTPLSDNTAEGLVRWQED